MLAARESTGRRQVCFRKSVTSVASLVALAVGQIDQ